MRYQSIKYLFFLIIGILSLSSHQALALCAAPPVNSGLYQNVDRNTRSITRIRLEFVCIDTIAIPAGASQAEIRRIRAEARRRSGSWVRVWGKCHPRDCAWGRERARTVGRGTGRHLRAMYRPGFAVRSVRIIPMRGSRIRVIVDSLYNDGRRPRTWRVTMRRIGR